MSKKLDRRSFLSRLGATAGIGALGLITGASVAQTPRSEAQVTDNDTGTNSDPVGRGRGTSDRAGNGRQCSDNDAGSRADPGGRGRGCTDSD